MPAGTVGRALRDAREAQDATLTEIHDRTGVHWRDLEALEAGNLAHFTDQRAALVAVRRYAEVVGLPAEELERTVEDTWRSVVGFESSYRGPAGVAAPSTGVAALPAVGGPGSSTGHLPRHPGDGSHLRAFTQTAQVPGVRPGFPTGSGPATVGFSGPKPFDATDAIPVTLLSAKTPAPVPLALRAALWCTVVLLVIGVAGLAVHRWRPLWLEKIHVVASPTSAPASRVTTPTPHASQHAAPPGPVSLTAFGNGSATVTVRATQYQVVLSTGAPCWVQVTGPASFVPAFSATLPGGSTKTFAAEAGQLSIELGASHASLSVEILGKVVPGWTFTPSSAPFLVHFTSSTA